MNWCVDTYVSQSVGINDLQNIQNISLVEVWWYWMITDSRSMNKKDTVPVHLEIVSYLLSEVPMQKLIQVKMG
jgi:hypothetical protein